MRQQTSHERAAPRALGDTGLVTERVNALRKEHVRQLTALVEELRGQCQGKYIPWFDPESGGVRAQVLLLLEAPGPMAAKVSKRPASGFVSLDNDDPTAANLFRFVRDAGLSRDAVLMWNIVPWYVGDGDRVKAPESRDIDAGAVWLKRLLDLLGDLRVAVLLGGQAQRGWMRATRAAVLDVPVVACPHPSGRMVRTRPEAQEEIVGALQRAAEYLARARRGSSAPQT